MFAGWFEIGVGILGRFYFADVKGNPKKIYIFSCARVREGHPAPLVLGLATPTAIYGNEVIDMGQNSAPVPSPTKKRAPKTVPSEYLVWICGRIAAWVGCIVISQRVVPSSYSRISKLSSLKIFFVDKSKPYAHNIGVGSSHTLAHLPTPTVFSEKERGYSGTSAYTSLIWYRL